MDNNNNNNNDKKKKEDEKAKASARSKNPPAARPGAVSVRGAEASRLDQRIEEKRTATTSSATEAPVASLNKLEQDIQAKQRARAELQAGRSAGAAASSPAGRSQLEALEGDIAAKNRVGRSGASTPGVTAVSSSGRSQLDNLESDIAAKNRASSGGITTKPGATAVSASSRNQLQSLEDQVSAKTRSHTTNTNTNTPQDTALTTLEDRIRAKTRQNDAKPPPPAAAAGLAQLQSMEDRIAAKVRASTGAGGDGGAAVDGGLQRSSSNSYQDIVSAKMRANENDMKKPPPPSSSSPMNDDNYEGLLINKLQGGGTASASAASQDLADRKLPPGAAATTTSAAAAAAGMAKAAPADAAFSKDAPAAAAAAADAAAAKKDGRNGGEDPMTGQKYDQDQPPMGGSLLDHEDVEFGIYDAGGNEEGLAVAVAIEEEDENVFIPAAVEYDPDAKPPMYQNRRFRLYAFSAFCVLIVVAIGAGVGISMAKDDSTTGRAAYRQSLGIREKIEELIGTEELEEANSPYGKALQWITLRDTLELVPEDPNFIQRYILAYFYFATSEKKPWAYCSPPVEEVEEEEEQDDSCVYLDFGFSQSTLGSPVPAIRWLTDHNECAWAGVKCDKFQQVKDIELGKFLARFLLFVMFPFLRANSSSLCLLLPLVFFNGNNRWREYDRELPARHSPSPVLAFLQNLQR